MEENKHFTIDWANCSCVRASVVLTVRVVAPVKLETQ